MIKKWLHPSYTLATEIGDHYVFCDAENWKTIRKTTKSTKNKKHWERNFERKQKGKLLQYFSTKNNFQIPKLVIKK